MVFLTFSGVYDVYEYVKVLMYECSLYDCIYCMTVYDRWDSMKRDKTGKMGGGLTLQYKHSAYFLGDDIFEKNWAVGGVKTWHKVATDAS